MLSFIRNIGYDSNLELELGIQRAVRNRNAKIIAFVNIFIVQLFKFGIPNSNHTYLFPHRLKKPSRIMQAAVCDLPLLLLPMLM